MTKGYILEQGEQGVSVASKSLMDENYDRFFTVTAENFHTPCHLNYPKPACHFDPKLCNADYH